jgi:hypothetical protein
MVRAQGPTEFNWCGRLVGVEERSKQATLS